MMTQKIQMTTKNSFLHLRVGAAMPLAKQEEELIRQRATHFYWAVFRLLHKEAAPLSDGIPGRVLRLSFEDDYEEDSFDDERFDDDEPEDDDFLAGEDADKEGNELLQGWQHKIADELYYK